MIYYVKICHLKFSKMYENVETKCVSYGQEMISPIWMLNLKNFSLQTFLFQN